MDMDTLFSLSSPLAALTTSGEHRETKALRKGLLALFVLLTVNSGLVLYILWGNLVSVASVGFTYVALGLLLGRRFGCWEPGTDGGRRCLDAAICFVFLFLVVLEVSSWLERTLASSSTSAPMLVAAAGAATLVLGGCCAYLLHRRSWSK